MMLKEDFQDGRLPPTPPLGLEGIGAKVGAGDGSGVYEAGAGGLGGGELTAEC